MSELVYADVDGLSLIPELERLFPEHYEELCVTKDFPANPDYDAYRRMGEAGMLRTITCRVDGELIGYIVFIVQPHLHYRDCRTAFEDLYFIKKEWRKGRLGIKLFQYAEKVLKERGVNRIIMHTKVHLDHTRLFEYLGYKHTDKLFTKML